MFIEISIIHSVREVENSRTRRVLSRRTGKWTGTVVTDLIHGFTIHLLIETIRAQVLENLKCNFSLEHVASQSLLPFSARSMELSFASHSYSPCIPSKMLQQKHVNVV